MGINSGQLGLIATGAIGVGLGSLCLQQALTPRISQGTISPTSSQPATIIESNPNQALLMTNWLLLSVGGLGLIGWGCFGEKPVVAVPLTDEISPPLPPPSLQLTPQLTREHNPIAEVEPPPPEPEEDRHYPDWDWALNGIFFKGTRTAHHFSINGATGEGKTTLTESLITLLSEWERQPIILIIDPKYAISEPTWSVEPICQQISDSLSCLLKLNDLMQARVNHPSFQWEKARPIFIVIDEVDWIFNKFTKKAVDAIRNLIKLGRGRKIIVFLVGQSAQCGKGLDSSDYRQTCRFILGSEAIAFMSNPQNFWGSELKPSAKTLQREGIRFAFVVPCKGDPYLAPIPEIKLEITPSTLKPAPKLDELIAIESGKSHPTDPVSQEFYQFLKKKKEGES